MCSLNRQSSLAMEFTNRNKLKKKKGLNLKNIIKQYNIAGAQDF